MQLKATRVQLQLQCCIQCCQILQSECAGDYLYFKKLAADFVRRSGGYLPWPCSISSIISGHRQNILQPKELIRPIPLLGNPNLNLRLDLEKDPLTLPLWPWRIGQMQGTTFHTVKRPQPNLTGSCSSLRVTLLMPDVGCAVERCWMINNAGRGPDRFSDRAQKH